MTRIDLTTRELHGLITPVFPHASTNPEDPALNAVRLEATPRVLYAVATDRFTLAAERLPLDDIGDHFVVTIDRAEAAAMLRLFTYTKDADPKLTLTDPDNAIGTISLRVDSEDGTRLILHGIDRPFEPATALGNWRRVLAKALHRAPAPAAPTLVLAPALVPRWAKAARKGETLRVFPGPDPLDPILVTVEEHFAGVWQPVGHLYVATDMLADNPWCDEIAATDESAEPAGDGEDGES